MSASKPLLTSSTQHTPAYKFDPRKSAWHVANLEIDKDDGLLPTAGAFKFVTFNVLFDHWFRPNVVQAPRRYQKVLQLLEEADADVVCLNEVTSLFVNMLCSEAWVREKYFVSEIPSADGKLKTIPPNALFSRGGNLILSKWKPAALFTCTIDGLDRPAIISCFSFPSSPRPNASSLPPRARTLVMASAHLTAVDSNFDRRRDEVFSLYDALDRLSSSQFPDHACDKLIMGDLNFHRPSEDTSIREDYTDIWRHLNPNSPGYTYDMVRNPMIQHRWPFPIQAGFEFRRMRLDRVLLCGTLLKPSSIEFFGDRFVSERKHATDDPETRRVESIFTYRSLPSRALQLTLDLLSLNVLRDPDLYLFPSDHFGLLMRGSFSDSD